MWILSFRLQTTRGLISDNMMMSPLHQTWRMVLVVTRTSALPPPTLPLSPNTCSPPRGWGADDSHGRMCWDLPLPWETLVYVLSYLIVSNSWACILCSIRHFLHIKLSGVHFVLYRALIAHQTLKRAFCALYGTFCTSNSRAYILCSNYM